MSPPVPAVPAVPVAAPPSPRRLLAHRAAVALVLVASVGLLGVVRDLGGPALRLGEPASEDVFATREVRVVDEDATLTARRAAAESVDAVLVPDPDAQRAVVADLRAAFAAAREVRTPVPVEPDPTEEAPAADAEVAEPPTTRTPSWPAAGCPSGRGSPRATTPAPSCGSSPR